MVNISLIVHSEIIVNPNFTSNKCTISYIFIVLSDNRFHLSIIMSVLM